MSDTTNADPQAAYERHVRTGGPEKAAFWTAESRSAEPTSEALSPTAEARRRYADEDPRTLSILQVGFIDGARWAAALAHPGAPKNEGFDAVAAVARATVDAGGVEKIVALVRSFAENECVPAADRAVFRAFVESAHPGARAAQTAEDGTGAAAESHEIQRLEDEAAAAVAAWWEITTGDTELEDVARDFLRHPCHVHGSTNCPALDDPQ